MAVLKMTVGLPRSGKSTWAMEQGVPVVNPDSIRMALYNDDFRVEGEIMVWAIAKYMVKALFLTGHETVILDSTNLTARRRDEWANVMWEREYVLFSTAASVCADRAVASGRSYLLPVIDRMVGCQEVPNILLPDCRIELADIQAPGGK